MEDGFLLDEFNEEQFESLLDTHADQLPDLDTGVLGQGGHDTSGLDVLNEDIFESSGDVTPHHVSNCYSSLPSPGGPMLNQPLAHPSSHRSSSSQPGCSPHPSMHASPHHPSPHYMQSPASVPQSPATHQFATPSPAQPPSPVTYLPMKSPAALPPPPSPANLPPPQSPVTNMTPQPSPATYIPPQSPVTYIPPQSPITYIPPQSPVTYIPPQSPAGNYLPPQSPASSIPPSSPINRHYSIKSPGSGRVTPKSPRGSVYQQSTTSSSLLSPQPVSLPQNSVIFAHSGPGGGGGGSGTTLLPPGASLVPGNIISSNHHLGMQPLQLSSNGTIVSGGQVFQIQLQPNNGVGSSIVTNSTIASKPSLSTASNKGSRQPQLLPKPISNISSQAVAGHGVSISHQDRSRVFSNSVVSSQPQAAPSVTYAQPQQHSIIINSNGVISGVQQGGIISGLQQQGGVISGLQQGGVISGVQHGGVISGVQQSGTPIIINGQMMSPSVTGAGSPMIIQQSNGGQMFVLRPNAPMQTTPTLVPIGGGQHGLQAGQIIVQQGGQARGVLASNQQVKLIPQNQVQMQQIQTPSGPKLIALPFGQTLVQSGQNIISTSNSGGIQLTPGGSIQLQANPSNINLSNSSVIASPAPQGIGSGALTLQPAPSSSIQQSSSMQQATSQSLPFSFTNQQQPIMSNITSNGMVISNSLSQPLVTSIGASSSTGSTITADSVIQQNRFFDPHSLSPKKKKSKKKKRDLEEAPQVITSQPSTTTAQKTFDLGALMKDAGLDIEDLDSFSMDQTTSGSQLDLGFNTHITMNPTSIQSTQDSSQLSGLNQMNPMDIMHQDNTNTSPQSSASAPGSRQQTSQQSIFGQQQIQISGQQNSGQIIGIGADGIISSSQHQQQAQIIGNQSVQIIGQQQLQQQQHHQHQQSAGEITTTNNSLSYAMTSGGIIQGGQPQISRLPVPLQEHPTNQPARVQMSSTSVNNSIGGFSINTSGVHTNQVVVTSSAGSGGQQMISQQQGITINSSGQLIGGDGGSISTAGLPPGSSFQLLRGPDGQYILQTAPPSNTINEAANTPTPVINNTTTAANSLPVTIQQQPQQVTSTPPPRSSPRSTQRSRQPADPNRTPLMEDDTLPHSWYRKVSQRKSGASAGRYEVFIIGPSGKRFRSRNELKAFFEKTGETTLNPDDFDFSTFGKNNAKGAVSSIISTGAKAGVSGHSSGSGVVIQRGQVSVAGVVQGSEPGIVIQRKFAQPVTQSSAQPTTQPQVIGTNSGLPSGFQIQITNNASTHQVASNSSNLVPGINLATSTTLTQPGGINFGEISVTTNAPTTPIIHGQRIVVGGSVNQVTSASAISPESELIKKLEVSGMASVAAARALETAGTQGLNTRNNLLQNIQEPLPQSALTSPPALNLPSAPPSIELKPGTARANNPRLDTQQTSSFKGASSYQDADEHISNLLKRLHQQPLPVQVKQELLDSTGTAGGGTQAPGNAGQQPVRHIIKPSSNAAPNIKSPEPPVISTLPNTVVKSNIFSENAHSPSMPVLLPQVTVSEQSILPSSLQGLAPGSSLSINNSSSIPNSRIQDSSFQNSYLDSLAKSQIPDKKSRGRASSGAGNRIPTLLSPPGSSVDTGVANIKPASVIHQNPRFEPPTMLKSESGLPTSISIQTTSLPPGPPNLSLGGAGSQIRAMQHAHPNTRLVKGPNGQVTVQKVQTIELTHEMQRTYKKVEQRISDIEHKVIKTAQDEAELASLQAKQLKILSTGRPVNVAPQQTQQTMPPSHQHTPGQTSISQASNLQPQTLTSQPSFISNQQIYSSIGQPTLASSMSVQSTNNASVEMRLSGSNQQPTPQAVISSNNMKSGGQVIMSTSGQGGSIIRPIMSQGSNKRIVGSSGGDLPPGSIVLPPGMSPAMAAGQHIQLMGAQSKPGPSGQPSILSVQGLKPVPQSELQASSGHIINPALPDIRQRFVPDPRVKVPSSFNKSQQAIITSSNQEEQEVKYLGTQPLVTNPALMSMPGGQIAATAGPIPKSMLQAQPPQQSSIPQLTDGQKRIIAEFKAKYANLPPEQQQAFITANKTNLLKQLNFQPSQLNAMQGSNRAPQPGAIMRPGMTHIEAGRQTNIPGSGQLQPVMIPGTVPQMVVKPSIGLPDVQQQTNNTHILVNTTDNRQKVLPNINKAKKIAWVESQLKKDQHEAVNPNYKAPFRSKEDACKRLLRYHVFDEPSITGEEWEQSEEEFSSKSVQLLNKYDSMLSKYHILLLQESTRLCSSSEEVMLSRQWEADERSALSKEKEEYIKKSSRLNYLESKSVMSQEDVEELEGLLEEKEPGFPEIPVDWYTKYEQVVGKPYEPKESIKEESDIEEVDTKDFDMKTNIFTKKMEHVQPLTPIQDIEIKKEHENSEMPVLEDERLYQHPPDIKCSIRSRNSSQASIDSFRSEQGSISSLKKELRVGLTNILSSAPHLKKELLETGSIHSSSSRPQSVADMSSPEPSSVFLGLKFARSSSGRWSTTLKRELDEGELRLPADTPDWKRARTTDSPHFDSDSDDDFCLSNVRGGETVQSMLSRTDHDDEDNIGEESGVADDGSGHGLRFFPHGVSFSDDGGGVDPRHTPVLSEQGDTDSVQNVVNSILDMHDCGRIETPDDLNGLTGLLDSMEEEEEGGDEDSSVDAAVKSIQDFI